MLFRTHFVFGLLFALLALYFINPINKYIFIMIVVLSSLLPDLDHKESFINNKLKIFKSFSYFVKHRGILHSIWIPLALWLLLDFGFNSRYGSAVFIGYLSHLFSDGLTKAGINIVHPLKQLRIQGFIETGSILEHLVFLFVCVCCVVLIL